MRSMVRPKPAADLAIAKRLRDFHAALRKHFGYHPRWWPGTPWEIALSAILVQQCDWRSAWSAIRRLDTAGLLPPEALAKASQEDVRRQIHGVAFGPTKAGRLIRLAISLEDHGSIENFLASADTPHVRRQLLELPGIGPETADSILLYAGEHRVFVVDAYTRRVFQRLQILPVPDAFWERPYAELQTFFQSHLRSDLDAWSTLDFDQGVTTEVALFRDLHALIVELGRHHCLKTKPRCHAPGRDGWAGYDVCLSHCARTGTCTACPLAGICAGTGE